MVIGVMSMMMIFLLFWLLMLLLSRKFLGVFIFLKLRLLLVCLKLLMMSVLLDFMVICCRKLWVLSFGDLIWLLLFLICWMLCRVEMLVENCSIIVLLVSMCGRMFMLKLVVIMFGIRVVVVLICVMIDVCEDCK